MKQAKALVMRKREERIIAVAKEHFLKRGYEKAAILEIAKECDVAVGTVYKHFDSKEALFLAVINEEFKRLMRAVKRSIRYVACPLERFKIFAALRLRVMEKNRTLFEKDIQNVSIFLMQNLKNFDSFYHKKTQFLSELAEEMIKKEILDPGHPKLYANLMESLTDGFVHSYFVDQITRPDHKTFGDQVTRILLKGLGKAA